MTPRCIVVDDEPLARRRLRAMLAAHADFEVLGEYEDAAGAVAAIRALRPDVVFLDVQMPGMNGFEVVAALEPEQMPLVVFVTAYDEFALRAFEVCAIDYLVKPVAAARLRTTLERVRTQLRGRDRGDLESRLRALTELARPAEHVDRFLVKRGQKFVFVRVEDVFWIEAADNYVKVHTAAGVEMLRSTLGSLESRLDPRRFVRVHRGAIINIDRLQGMEAWGQGEYLLILANGTRINSSRTYRTSIRQALGAMDSG